MLCTCGISYSDNLELWVEVDLDDGSTVYVSECPDCHEPGVKFVRSGNGPESAVVIYPTGIQRKPINLAGVPAETEANYLKALRALPTEFYSTAAILARKSLESSLAEKYGSGKGERLNNLIDELLADQSAPISPGVQQNIDAVRQLGNMEAHEFDALTIEQVEWGVRIWERFLTDWYVQPLEDKTHRGDLAAANRQVKQPPAEP